MYHLIEITTPWTYEGANGSALIMAYQTKVSRYQPLIPKIEEKKPGHKVEQTREPERKESEVKVLMAHAGCASL
jgi:hypothetical protein